MGDRCECGFSTPNGAVRPDKVDVHEEYHASWASGLPLPEAVFQGSDGIYYVTPNSAPEEIMTANQMALRMHVELPKLGGVGKSLYPPSDLPRTAPGWRGNPRAYVLVRNRRAIAITILRDHDTRNHGWSIWDGQTETPIPNAPGTRLTVDMVFVCKDYRCQGLATSLVDHAVSEIGVSPDQLAWQEPFEPGGEAIAKRYAIQYGVTYRMKT